MSPARFTREYCANRRVRWVASVDGLTLLVVRDARPLRYWWRVRRGTTNLAKGAARDARDGMKRARKALREYQRSAA